jgi:hypothetical protein
VTSGKPARKGKSEPRVFPNPRGSRYLRLLLTCPMERQDLPATTLTLLTSSGLAIDRCVIESDVDTGVIDIDIETSIPGDRDVNCQDLVKRVRALPAVDLKGVLVDERLSVSKERDA